MGRKMGGGGGIDRSIGLGGQSVGWGSGGRGGI